MSLPLEEYLVGVIAAEMPAKFNLEALKAQAVTARTYAAKRMFNYGAKPCAEHPEAETCTDPTHCQAWNDEKEMMDKWGRLKYYSYLNKIKTALYATSGQVIIYHNTLIDPVYHSSCGGKGTENSEDVWSSPTPYLRGVSCSQDFNVTEEAYSKEVSQTDLGMMIRKTSPGGLPAVTGQGPFIQLLQKSIRGRVQEIKIFGQRVAGNDLRQLLGLTSCYFSWVVTGSTIKFTSIGKGHAVGLCQYGANNMAGQGKGYQDIITHYYTGVEIQKIRS